jgi:hypothetical protein
MRDYVPPPAAVQSAVAAEASAIGRPDIATWVIEKAPINTDWNEVTKHCGGPRDVAICIANYQDRANGVAPSAFETELTIESRGTPHQPMRQPVSPLTVQQVATKQPQSISPLCIQPAMQTMQAAEASNQNEVRRF